MANEKRLIAFDPITFESFTRHATKHREPDACQYDMGYVDACDQIDDWLDANTVTAVEVVRCKDCRHWDGTWKPKKGNEMHGYCCNDEEPAGRWENDFCSYGERKDNG